jgi:SP family facilitated glucose transporter-like MFS transporter 8
MLGEMYPPEVKGLAGGLTTCLAYLFSFAALKMYPFLLVLFGGDAVNPKTSSSEGVFYFYGAMSFVATLFVLLFLTETHRKSLRQIEREFVERPLARSVALWCRDYITGAEPAHMGSGL